MAKIQLTLACGNDDRTNALALSDVEPEGIELNYLRLPVEETYWRMLRHVEALPRFIFFLVMLSLE